MGSFQKGLSPEQFSALLENIRENIDKQKERSRDTHLRQEIIKEDIVELEQPMLESIRERKPIDYQDKIDKLNNTIDNLQSSINALSFNQIPATQSKKIHEGITQTIPDPAISSEIEGAESREEQFSTSILSPKKPTLMHYDFDSNLNTYEDLLKEYKHKEPSTLFNYYTKKIKEGELTRDNVKEELGMIIQSTQLNSQRIGGQMTKVVKKSEKHKDLKEKLNI